MDETLSHRNATCCSFEAQLEGIVSDLHEYNRTIESRIKAAGFKARVMQVFAAWTEWAVYPKDFLALLKHIFLGGQPSLAVPTQPLATEKPDGDIDGAPLSGDEKDDEDLDGIPLDGAALLKSALARRDFAQGPVVHSPSSVARGKPAATPVDDIDGIPLGGGDGDDYDDDIDGIPMESTGNSSGFIPSKWETIAPDEVEAQAITTSKWDTLDHRKGASRKRSYDSSDDEDQTSEASRHSQRDSYDEEKRAKLREVELRTIQYQDEFESGERSLRDGQSLTGQLELFRQRLMKKSLSELRGPTGDVDRYGSSDRRRSISPDE